MSDKRACDIGERADDIVNQEAPRAPAVFQRRADHVVEIQAQRHPEDAALLRHEQPRHQPPYLPLQHGGNVQRQVANQADARGIGRGHAQKQIQQEHAAHGENNIAHNGRDVVFVQPALQTIEPIVHRHLPR